MEEAYRRLEARVTQLDRELAAKHHELALTIDYLNSILESMSDGRHRGGQCRRDHDVQPRGQRRVGL